MMIVPPRRAAPAPPRPPPPAATAASRRARPARLSACCQEVRRRSPRRSGLARGRRHRSSVARKPVMSRFTGKVLLELPDAPSCAVPAGASPRRSTGVPSLHCPAGRSRIDSGLRFRRRLRRDPGDRRAERARAARHQAGPLGLALAASMPLIAAIVAAYAVERPWPAFAVILLLTPCWDAAQVSWDVSPVWQVGTVQVVLQTVFVVALALGIVLRDSEAHDLAASGVTPGRQPAPVPPRPRGIGPQPSQVTTPDGSPRPPCSSWPRSRHFDRRTSGPARPS